MIKAIIFDLDGVYFINGKENFIANIVAFGVKEEEVIRVFIESEEMNHKYKTGKWNDDEFWNWALKEWKLSKTVPQILDLLINCYELNLEVADFVKKVRAQGYKTLICSNNFPARINGLQKRFKFLNDFDVAVMSYEVGYTKPHIKIFIEAVKKAGVQPEEIFIADDNQMALKTAEVMEMQTYLYEDFKGFKQALSKLGVNIT
jgi:HAD superfamily hydrolase (TIGR01509 family)